MEQHPSEGGGPNRLPPTPCWPRYIGALALDAWLARLATIDVREPSVEMCIAQYPGGADELLVEAHDNDSIQLPLHLQWGDELAPTDLSERPLSSEDAGATRRMLATAVSIFAGRTALFGLYDRLEPRTYAAMITRLSTGTRLPASAELKSMHSQYAAKGVIEACGMASAGDTTRAVVTRLERRRRRWMGTELRLL